MTEREHPPCKNTRWYDHPNHYGDKYNGYCLDCSNAGVPELVDELAAARADAERLAISGNQLWQRCDPNSNAAKQWRAAFMDHDALVKGTK